MHQEEEDGLPSPPSRGRVYLANVRALGPESLPGSPARGRGEGRGPVFPFLAFFVPKTHTARSRKLDDLRACVACTVI